MKIKILLAAALLLALGSEPAARAQTSLSTSNANGLPAAPAEIIFPADPATQIAVVGVNWLSDTSTAALKFQTAVGAYSVLRTNRATTDVTQEVASTSGLITNRWLLLQRGPGPSAPVYKALIVATNNGTNVILGSGGFGAISVVGDSLYPLSTTNAIPVGATTNWANGVSLFAGGRGRPVRVWLEPTGVSNSLPAVTVSRQ